MEHCNLLQCKLYKNKQVNGKGQMICIVLSALKQIPVILTACLAKTSIRDFVVILHWMPLLVAKVQQLEVVSVQNLHNLKVKNILYVHLMNSNVEINNER